MKESRCQRVAAGLAGRGPRADGLLRSTCDRAPERRRLCGGRRSGRCRLVGVDRRPPPAAPCMGGGPAPAPRRPRQAWEAVGARKWLWVFGMLVGTYFVVGLIFVLLYVGGVRK